MLRHRPLIAINPELTHDDSPRASLQIRYAEAVFEAGGEPWVLCPLAPAEHEIGTLRRADGLLISGGDDFDTEFLGLGPVHPEAKPIPQTKQSYDWSLTRAALEGSVPVLGICYGMQLLALCQGGSLYQHIPGDRPGAQEHLGGILHDVRIEPGTKLGELVGVDPLPVVSRHHQAVREVGPEWRVCARDTEGLIEAVEHAAHPFALGVQWHPEQSGAERPGGPRHERLFEGLVEAARQRQDSALAHLSDRPRQRSSTVNPTATPAT